MPGRNRVLKSRTEWTGERLGPRAEWLSVVKQSIYRATFFGSFFRLKKGQIKKSVYPEDLKTGRFKEDELAHQIKT